MWVARRNRLALTKYPEEFKRDVVEIAIAIVLGFVPPEEWIIWFGCNELVESTGAHSSPIGVM